MAYSELIKDFKRSRDYLRSFYVYGFKRRDDHTEKSGRTYDNERRRVESWLGDYMSFRQDRNGRTKFVSVDSRAIEHNPLYRAFRAKSFPDSMIRMHFTVLDALSNGPLTATDISNAILYSGDESNLRKHLNKYVQLGILKTETEGRSTKYALREDRFAPKAVRDLLSFASEAMPLGVVGSYLLDKTEGSDSPFRFKHHYILNTLDSEIVYALLPAIREHRVTELVKERNSISVLPIRFYISTQTGRQYLLHYAHGAFRFSRLDSVREVKVTKARPEHIPTEEEVRAFTSHLWGVSVSNAPQTEHVEMTVRVLPEEQFVAARLEREKRCGTVERIDDLHWRFVADVYDAVEMMPWVRTFIGRITSFKSTNKEAERRFRENFESTLRMYGGDADALS